MAPCKTSVTHSERFFPSRILVHVGPCADLQCQLLRTLQCKSEAQAVFLLLKPSDSSVAL